MAEAINHMYSAAEVANVMHASIMGPHEHTFSFLATDSRRIAFPENTCFIALTTARRDGHDFVESAYQQGVRVFVVSRIVPALAPDATLLLVNDPLRALHQLAAWHRRKFSCPVVGITGSNGKTIVKDWLFQMLQARLNIVRSPRSYNSQIGVPLSVWLMKYDTELGIFEAGISQFNEMQALQAIIEPTIGIFTMLGAAHDEGFSSRDEKLAEKFLLFSHCHKIIYCADDEKVDALARRGQAACFAWGHYEGAWMRILESNSQKDFTTITTLCQAKVQAWKIPFTDAASLQNAMHCLAFLVMEGYDESFIQQQLDALRLPEMRMHWKQAIHNCRLLNDAYINDFTSMTLALDNLLAHAQRPKKTVILSDLSVSDAEAPHTYPLLERLLSEKRIDRFVGIGPQLSHYAAQWQLTDCDVLLYGDTDHFLADFHTILFLEEDILLKGSRVFAFERIASRLELKQHQTWLEIHLPTIAANLSKYRQLMAPGTKTMAMVKAFGYGTGETEVARMMEHKGVDYLAVAYADEGRALREAGLRLPVMVLNTDPGSFGLLEAFNLEPEIFSHDNLDAFLVWCRNQGLQYFPVHLKIDTGMHRLGFGMDEIEPLASKLMNQTTVIVKSVFTHLVASEDSSADDFTARQLALFDEACLLLRNKLGYPFLRHAANSAAIKRHPRAQYDMVRLGYGLFDEVPGMPPALKLFTTVSQVKEVAAGETVGYGRKAVLSRNSRIATVCIGYADGYRRMLGNGVGCMHLNGREAPTVGHVCMDMTMLDVTDLPAVKPGDRVEVLGENITLARMGAWLGTIGYEIMTGIGHRVKRIYFDE